MYTTTSSSTDLTSSKRIEQSYGAQHRQNWVIVLFYSAGTAGKECTKWPPGFHSHTCPII